MFDLNTIELIVAKRDGRALGGEAIRSLIDAYTRGAVPDYQMSAFLMAALLKGMDEQETAALTNAMLYSGTVLDLSGIPGIKVDKHSTGGVGDKVSLILAPVVAACGVPVPMISGRGLGHTGGTLDKLESIPGFRVDLSAARYAEQLGRIGLVMIGQTEEIAPADRKLYALRDATGTVEFIPFIASSIMSKKLAEGIDALALDVKCGRGAFMKRLEDARRLAQTLIGIGERFGKKTTAWITAMDAPLGYAVGNWPEVVESISCLRGENVPDVMEVTLTLAGEMLFLGGASVSPEQGHLQAAAAIRSGKAFEKFLEMTAAQGGETAVVEQPHLRSDVAAAIEVRATQNIQGFVADVDALAIARTAVAMGAGRRRKEEAVDPTAGIVLAKKPGDAVEAGDLLARLYTKRTDRRRHFAEAAARAFNFSETPPEPQSLLLERLSSGRPRTDA